MRRRRRPSSAARLVAVAVLLLALAATAAALVSYEAPKAADRVTEQSAPAVAAAPERPPPLVRRVLGSGARSVAIVRRAGQEALPAVIFLHGWGYQRPRDYRGWIRHLARAGNTVIVPRYQIDERSDPATVRPAMLAGIRRALRTTAVETDRLVVAGHSAGGALAADYAAVAHSLGLPEAAGVFVVYPGRAIIGTPGIPQADLSRIPSRTRLVVLAGARDAIVGTEPARLTYEGASSIPNARRRFALVRDGRVADHLAPLRSGRVARRTFWRRLDRLIARSRMS